MQGVDSEALESVIRFFYTAEILITMNTVVPLLDAAIKLDVGGLIVACEQFIQSLLYPATAIQFLQQSVHLKIEMLTEALSAFIGSRWVGQARSGQGSAGRSGFTVGFTGVVTAFGLHRAGHALSLRYASPKIWPACIGQVSNLKFATLSLPAITSMLDTAGSMRSSAPPTSPAATTTSSSRCVHLAAASGSLPVARGRQPSCCRLGACRVSFWEGHGGTPIACLMDLFACSVPASCALALLMQPPTLAMLRSFSTTSSVRVTRRCSRPRPSGSLLRAAAWRWLTRCSGCWTFRKSWCRCWRSSRRRCSLCRWVLGVHCVRCKIWCCGIWDMHCLG